MKFRSRIERSFFTVILCLALSLMLYQYFSVTRRLERHITQHLQGQVVRVQQGLDRFWEQRQREILLMALSPVLGSTRLEPKLVQDRLRQFRDTLKVYDRLSLVGPDGRIVADTVAGRIGAITTSEPFQRGLDGGNGHLFSFNSDRQQATMTFYAGLTDPAGRVQRVLLATVQADQLHQVIGNYSDSLLDTESGGVTELLASDGRRLYASRDLQGVFQIPHDWPELRRQLPAQLTHDINRVLGGAGRIDVLATTGPVGLGLEPWVLRTSLPTATVFRGPRLDLLLSLGVTALLLLVAWLWMRSIAASLSRPLELLSEAAEHAGQGDFSQAVTLPDRQDEFGPLFEKFQQMASSLDEQTRALQAANAEWRKTFDTVQDPLCIIDQQFHITRSNLAMLELLGKEEKQVLGGCCHQLLHGGQAAVEQCPHYLSMQDHKPHQLERYEPLFDRWFRVTAAPLFDAAGSAIGSVHMLHDITAERFAADSLRQAAEASQQANQAKSRFLAVMSHEIRTPLNGINGMVQLLRDSQLTSDQAEFLDCIEISADNLLTVINDILDFSKIEAGRMQLESAPFSLRKLAGDLLRVQRLRAQVRGLQFTVSVAAEVPDQVVGDQFRLRQILNNLVSNAIKFTHGGEVAVTLACNKAGDALLLTAQVRDTGIGIAPEAQATIFDPFVQADSSTPRTFGGTGLGLAICRQLVELMGGVIGVTSAPGQGATFSFTARLLPASPAVSGAAQPEEPVMLQPLSHQLKVLVAEDQPINRKFMEEVLRRQDCMVLSACNGREAVALWQQEDVDLVLMDVQMPEMDGLAAMAAIRTQEDVAVSHTPIIAITAHAINGDKERLLESGFDGYLSKPVQVAALLTEMARTIESVTKERL